MIDPLFIDILCMHRGKHVEWHGGAVISTVTTQQESSESEMSAGWDVLG